MRRNDVNAIMTRLEKRLRKEVKRKDVKPRVRRRIKLKIEDYVRRNAMSIARRFCIDDKRQCLSILTELCRRYRAEYVEEYLQACEKAGIGVLAPLAVYKETGVLPSVRTLKSLSHSLHILESCLGECLPHEL